MSAKNLILSAAGAGGGPIYVEDVFSTYLYTGNGSTQTITNGIDLDGEGGLVWIKNRDQTDSHILTDTERGVLQVIASNGDGGSGSLADSVTAFNSDGFSISSADAVNTNTENFVSWTFRKAPKFFDVVTYTGTGARYRTVAHNLGSVPGCIMVKRTDTTGNWIVYHRANTGNPKTDYLVLNSTAATADQPYWEDTAPTDSTFMVNNNALVNASGGTYVAYLFAHEDGGFGDDGLENIITCGGYTGNGSATGPVITLNYEPQWLLIKRSDSTGNWLLLDTMRGIPTGYVDPVLKPNSNAVESSADDFVSLLSTGFQLVTSDNLVNASGGTYIYIAIRRGPMKTPTSGSNVYQSTTYTGNETANRDVIGNTNVFTDMLILSDRDANSTSWASYAQMVFDRHRNRAVSLGTGVSSTEVSGWQNYHSFSVSTAIGGWGLYGSSSNNTYMNKSGTNYVVHRFQRAPGFFDMVHYTGTGSATTFNHNLGVVPELIIIKKRSGADNWAVYFGDNTDFLLLDTTAARSDDNTYWNDTSPTSSVFTVGTNADVNTSAATYIAYLFASLARVSKVGTYTGNGTSVSVNTGFQPRFILVKRIDSTGNWVLGNSATGLVAGNDPFIEINEAVAETTNEDWVDVSATGFTANQTTENLNVNTATYIYLAIA